MMKKIKTYLILFSEGPAGLGLATVILNIGFFRTIFVVAFVGTGAVAGIFKKSRKQK